MKLSTASALLTVLCSALMITIVVVVLLEHQAAQRPTIATTAHQARSVMRDCVKKAGRYATIKTIYAGEPPVPVYYEIVCDK